MSKTLKVLKAPTLVNVLKKMRQGEKIQIELELKDDMILKYQLTI